jgi:hypothetical protein
MEKIKNNMKGYFGKGGWKEWDQWQRDPFVLRGFNNSIFLC